MSRQEQGEIDPATGSSRASERRPPLLLGLGANLGEPVRQIGEAVERIRAFVDVSAISSLYRTEPMGYADQPDFYNLVCRGTTGLGPEELLGAVQEIELALGRTRPFPNAPRTVDIDLLAYGDLVMDTPDLVLPHPRLHARAFVLVPLAEIAPEWRHPVLGATAAELLARSAPGRVERVEP